MEDKKTPARRARQPAAKRPAPTRPKAAAPKKTAPKPAAGTVTAGDADRQAMVAMAAYFRAQKRGFAPGYEVEDWVAAEAEISELTKPAPVKKPRVRSPRKSS